MKISQVLESQQLDELDMTNAGQTVGGAVGKTANALGAVAGGVKGAWDAAKAGFQQGKDFVSGQRAGSTDPKAINQAGPAGTAPAQAVQGAAGTAMGNMGKAMAGQKPTQAGATLYATVKQQINNLDSQSKQKLLNLVQKSIQQKPAKPAGGQQPGALSQMANALTGGGQQAPAEPNTMANAPVSKTNTANPGNPNLQQQQAQAEPTAPAEEPAATAPAVQPTATAPSAVDKKAMKNQYKADVAAATAAKQKPGFQQDAMDKLAMKKVNVGDGPKINAYGKQYEDFQFESKFLGMMI